MSAEPLPPQNIDAEENVLGALLMGGVLGRAKNAKIVESARSSGLVPEDFYRESHAVIYRALLAINERDEPTDVLVLGDELRSTGRLDDAGGEKRLHELAALATATENVAHHARLVVKASELRGLASAAAALHAEAMNGGDPSPEARERVVQALTLRRARDAEPVEFVTFDEFAARREPQADPLAVDADGGTVIAATGIGMFYGTGGVGKTTLCLDGVMHFAAGAEWIGGIRPTRKLRVAWIENEGPREEFRRKIERKLGAWRGRVKRDRLRVLDRPWSEYDLRRDDHRDALARVVTEADVDLLVIGPLHRLGMEGGGTPDDIRAFVALLEDVQRRAERRVSFLVVHHENRAGQVSGAWEGVPDLLVHVTPQANGRTRVYWQKARWSSTLHATAFNLTWADDEGFEVEEKAELDNDAIAEMIVAAVEAEPGLSWTRVVKQAPGVRAERRKAVRDELLKAERIVNVVKNEAGEEVALAHCPERRPAHLYPGDDPTIRHLRPDPDAGGTQAASARGGGETAALRPASRPYRDAGRRDAADTPQIALGADSYSDNTDAADDDAQEVEPQA